MVNDWLPPVAFHFRVDFLGLAPHGLDTRFQEVSGIAAEMQTEEIVEGGENRFTHRLPTRPKFGNLVLRRGLVSDSAVVAWVRDALENYVFVSRGVNVSLLNGQHEPVISYGFQGAYPVKWSVSELKAQDNAVAIESLELAYQYFRRLQ